MLYVQKVKLTLFTNTVNTRITLCFPMAERLSWTSHMIGLTMPYHTSYDQHSSFNEVTLANNALQSTLQKRYPLNHNIIV